MKYVCKKMKEEGVSPVIAVILMVAITVVLAGVLFVWVGQLAEIDEENPKLYFRTNDAAVSSDYFAAGNANIFENGEPILRLDQIKGDPVDWQRYDLLLSLDGSDDNFKCEIYSIASVNYTNGAKSKVSDVVLVHCPDPLAQFKPDDYVKLTIFGNDELVYESGLIRLK